MQSQVNELLVNDDELARSVLRLYPGIREIAAIARRVTHDVTYPVNSFDDLIASMGEEATLEVGGQAVSLAAARRQVPPYFFPVASQDDLVAKLDHLWRVYRVKQV